MPSGSPSQARGISRPTAGVLAPPPLIYLVPLILGLLFQPWHPIAVVGHRAAAPRGVSFLVLGLVCHLSAVLTLRQARTSPKPWRPTTAVVKTGPYRFTRNPIYLGFSLVYISVGFWVNALWPFVLLPLVLLVVQVGVITREEAYLERHFGNEYREYRQRVRRWL